MEWGKWGEGGGDRGRGREGGGGALAKWVRWRAGRGRGGEGGGGGDTYREAVELHHNLPVTWSNLGEMGKGEEGQNGVWGGGGGGVRGGSYSLVVHLSNMTSVHTSLPRRSGEQRAGFGERGLT